METDLVYYRRRSIEEAAKATAALDPKVQQIHRELARGYDERVAALEAEHRRADLRLVTAA